MNIFSEDSNNLPFTSKFVNTKLHKIINHIFSRSRGCPIILLLAIKIQQRIIWDI